MRVTYFGHSCFLVEVQGARLVIDPYLSENPHGRVNPATLRCDYVLCTHAHEDHIADAMGLVRAHRATLVAPYELAQHFATQGAKTIDLMPGGGTNLPWGRIDMTAALHSSALELPNGVTQSMGVASGYVVQAGGQKLYHAGDTGLFGDMEIIGKFGLDVAMIPIGDHYTMGPAAAIAALKLLRPKIAVPMHYNTTETIRVNPNAFAADAARAGHSVRVMGAGETWEF